MLVPNWACLSSSGCGLCADGSKESTLNHLFRDCAFASHIWKACSLGIRTDSDHMIRVNDWICNWIIFLYSQSNAIQLVTQFLSVVGSIWWIRNKTFFKKDHPNPWSCLSFQLASSRDAINAFFSTKDTVREMGFLNDHREEDMRKTIKESIPVQIIGNNSNCDMVSINVDASWKDDLTAAAGWVVSHPIGEGRVEEGIKFYAEKPLQAEALAVLYALKWGISRNFLHLHILTDCINLLYQLTDCEEKDHTIASVIEDIRLQYPRLHCLSISFIHRRFNKEADTIARIVLAS